MTQLNPKQIISECNLDSGIIEYLFRLKNGSINKQHGKPNALYVLKNEKLSTFKLIAIVDFDKNNKGADKILLSKFNEIKEISGNPSKYDFIGLRTHVSQNGYHKIIYFCSEAEDFLNHCLLIIGDKIDNYYQDFSDEFGVAKNEVKGLLQFSKNPKMRDSKTLKKIITKLIANNCEPLLLLKHEIESHFQGQN